MKKLLLLSSLLIFLSSCENEVDINAEYKDLSILYAALDPLKDTNWVRVQRGYLGEDAASEAYDKTDSLYYENLQGVFIKQYEPGGNTVENQVKLVKDESSRQLNEGTFTTQGYRLYRIPASFDLSSQKEYEITVVRENGSEANGRTGIVDSLDINRPREPENLRQYNGLIEFDNATNGDATAELVAYEIYFYFSYTEYNRNNGEETEKTELIKLPLFESTLTRSIQYEFTGPELINILSARLEEEPDNIIRFFEEIGIEIYGASRELYTYMKLQEPASGVNQNQPEYEQISNGTGIVTSRTMASRDKISLVTQLKEDLIYSGASCNLRFANIRQGDTCLCDAGNRTCF